LFESVRLEAARRGKTFKYFTNLLGRSSYVFNPYQQLNSKKGSNSQFVETISEALRFNHGDGYGTRFFSSQTREWLLETVTKSPNMTSFAELYEKTSSEYFRNEAQRDRCREAISVLQQIAQVRTLNWKPAPGGSARPLTDAIFMPDVIKEGQVVYFWLPAVGETSTVKETANLALYSLLTALKDAKDAQQPRQAYLFIDEAQQMASQGFKLILRQARSYGLSLILSTQSEADLMSKEANRLLDTVRTNTLVKLFLSANDPNTIKFLENVSGEHVSPDLLRWCSAHPDYALCWINRDSGLATYGGQCFPIQTYHHITKEEFERRDDAPWPAATESTIVAERTAEGTVYAQGSGEAAALPESENEVSIMPSVPSDSMWAKRLTEIFHKRNPGAEVSA
jgi:hypothetical protein